MNDDAVDDDDNEADGDVDDEDDNSNDLEVEGEGGLFVLVPTEVPLIVSAQLLIIVINLVFFTKPTIMNHDLHFHDQPFVLVL